MIHFIIPVYVRVLQLGLHSSRAARIPYFTDTTNIPSTAFVFTATRSDTDAQKHFMACVFISTYTNIFYFRLAKVASCPVVQVVFLAA